MLNYEKRTGSPEVDWTIERGRQLATRLDRQAYSPAEHQAVLVWHTWQAKGRDFKAFGWRNQETIRDAMTHMVEAYQGLAAAFGAAHVMGTEIVETMNGAELNDPRKGARGRAA